ncbi:hypothetical protein EG835_15285 [bacterium]|nr:hypothetical protein [bacterium]
MSDDQDFFFDEEETAVETPAEPAKSSGSKATAKATAPAAAPAAQAASGVQTVTMTVAALIGVVALLVGVIIGIVIPVGATDNVPAPTTTGTGATAPELSPEQLEGGALPEGHPDISGLSTAPAGTEATPTAP